MKIELSSKEAISVRLAVRVAIKQAWKDYRQSQKAGRSESVEYWRDELRSLIPAHRKLTFGVRFPGTNWAAK